MNKIEITPEAFKGRLIKAITSCDKVMGIGQTGDINAPLVPRKSDIDMFVICTEVPSKEGRFYPIGRLASIETLNVLYEKEKAWKRSPRAWRKVNTSLTIDVY